MKIVVVVLVVILVALLADYAYSESIPNWIRNNARWWSGNQITDHDFTTGLEYLIKHGIIKIPEGTQPEGESEKQIPIWLRRNAGWWAQGQLPDDRFLRNIQWLINNEFIRV